MFAPWILAVLYQALLRAAPAAAHGSTAQHSTAQHSTAQHSTESNTPTRIHAFPAKGKGKGRPARNTNPAGHAQHARVEAACKHCTVNPPTAAWEHGCIQKCTAGQPIANGTGAKAAAVRGASSVRLPVCYSDTQKGTLDGSWVRLAADPPPYWNLSCPYEWSKYSCVHQGALAHARAARPGFVPRGCRLLDVDGSRLARTLRGRRLHLHGDSLVRQVFIGLGCSTRDAIQDEYIAWGRKWPCHSTKNCVRDGVHSGFNSGSFFYDNSSVVVGFGRGGGPGGSSSKDVFVVEAGVHGNESRIINSLLQTLSSLNSTPGGRPLVVHMETPPQSFPGGPDGTYDREKLIPGLPKGCTPTVQNVRFQREVAAVHRAGLSGVVDAHLSLQGLNTLGRDKIGGGVGTYGDCTHYCMPGVPDVLAQALYTLLVQRLGPDT